jgi:hypothetical protein
MPRHGARLAVTDALAVRRNAQELPLVDPLAARSVGWWLMAGAGLFLREQYCWLVVRG